MLIGSGTFQAILAVAMIAVFALVAGSVALFRRGSGEQRLKAWLMLIAAMVLLGNVLIWTL